MKISRTKCGETCRAISIAATATGAALMLAGCGAGQQVGGASPSIGGDIGSSYGSSLSAARKGGVSALDRGAYPVLETSFQLGSIPGDPFDYTKVDVEVVIKKADGNNAEVPAFFDGGTTWRLRYTPTAPGQYAIVEIKLNKDTVHEGKLEKRDWTVGGKAKPGFVRIDRGNHAGFAMDNGDKYYPVGHNIAWQTDPKVNYDALFAKMHSAGENWCRIWLDQKDGKALDAATKDGKGKPGEIDLDVAKKWDAIVAAAQKNDIYFQLVLENSDALSSATGFPDSSNLHPAWDKNPLNPANGGTLKSPDAFFVDAGARSLEKRKLHYLLARWGYSPNIMAIELMHDAQNTDAAFGKKWDDIAMWHKEMSIFTKTEDGYHHLVTTSSAPGIPVDSDVWQTVDFIQGKVYASDLQTALTSSIMPSGKKLDKPYLVTEFGTPDGTDAEGVQLHIGLWSGLMAGLAGAPQYWDWDETEKQNLYSNYKAASDFVTASSLAEHTGLTLSDITVTTSQRGALSFGPGSPGKTVTGGQTEFVVGEGGAPSGMDRVGNILDAKSSSKLTFQTSYNVPGTFAVTLGKVSKGGARVTVAVDGKPQAKVLAASADDHAIAADAQALKVDVGAGSHTITVANDGADWVTMRRFTLGNYSPAIGGLVRSGKDYEIAWIYNRDGIEATAAQMKSVTPVTGTVKLPAVQKGKYRVIWWDTNLSKTLDSSDVDVTNSKEDIALTIPPITRDAALYFMKAGTDKAKVAKAKAANAARNGAQGQTGLQQPGVGQPGNTFAPGNGQQNVTPPGFPPR